MITDRQRLARASGLGSSDAAAVLGFNPYRSEADVLLCKLGLVDDDGAEAPSEAAEIGNVIEPAIATIASRRLGVPLVKPKSTFVHPEHDCLRANVDYQVERFGRGQPPVECKSSRLDLEWSAPDASRPHDALIPPQVLVQVVHQLICCGASEAHIARLSTGFRPTIHLYHIAAEGEVARLMDLMLKMLPVWWQKHVVNQDPLPRSAPAPSLELLRRIRREPESSVPIPGDLVLDWRRLDETAKDATERADEAKARVLHALGTAESGSCEHGMVTYMEQHRKAYAVPESDYRVARFHSTKTKLGASAAQVTASLGRLSETTQVTTQESRR